MKKNLLLHFAETLDAPIEDGRDLVEYNNNLNLVVLKGTTIPAVNYANEATETFTKSHGEGSDSDAGLSKNLTILMGTETRTFTRGESSDSDRDKRYVQELMATQTLTERVEATDSDK